MRSGLATSELGGEARAAGSPQMLGYWDGRAERQADADVKQASCWGIPEAETGLHGNPSRKSRARCWRHRTERGTVENRLRDMAAFLHGEIGIDQILQNDVAWLRNTIDGYCAVPWHDTSSGMDGR